MAAIVSPDSTVVVNVPSRLHWGSIIGGAFVALGLWILLDALGMALGLSTIDTGKPSSARTAGIVTGVWSVIMPLIALFVGSLVAARTAGITDRGTGIMHGAVLWALTTVVGTLLIGSVLTMMIGGAAAMGGKAMEATTNAASQAIGGSQSGSQGGADAMQALGIDADRLLAPLNRRLESQGKPAVTADQLKQATQETVRRALNEGRLDREQLIGAISAKTAISRDDATDLANQVDRQFTERGAQASAEFQRLQGQAQAGALQAADTTGKVLWAVFAALLLGLIASLVGAGVGVRQQGARFA